MGGTNLIFLAGSKALALSVGECLPKLAIFNSCSRVAASNSSAKSAFSFSAFNSNSRNSQASLTQPVLNLELFELQLPLLRELFELQLPLLCELFELLHALIAVPHALISVLHAQILILASLLLQFPQLAFPLPHGGIRKPRLRHILTAYMRKLDCEILRRRPQRNHAMLPCDLIHVLMLFFIYFLDSCCGPGNQLRRDF